MDSCKASKLLDGLSQVAAAASQLHRSIPAERESSVLVTPPTTTAGNASSTALPPHKKSKLSLDEPLSSLDWHQYQNQMMLQHIQQQQHQHPQLHHHFQPLPFGPHGPPPPPHWAAVAALNHKFLPPYVLNGYLSNPQEPPLLQNPERVIRLNECERFERTYQPNVALAPRQKPKEANPSSSNGGVLVKVKQEPAELTITTKLVNKSPEQFSSTEITSSTSPQPAVMGGRPQQHTMPQSLHQHHQPGEQKQQQLQELSSGEFKDNKSLGIFTVKLEPKQQHPTTGLHGNSEFELSTDTDDESSSVTGGEADSSNGLLAAPLEAAHQLLKDAKPESLDKVLGIIKMLLHENWQQRHVCQENVRLLEELRQKDIQVMELQSLLRASQQQLRSMSTVGCDSETSPVEASVLVKPEPRVPSDCRMNGERTIRSGGGGAEGAASPPLSCVKLKRKAIIEMNNRLNDDDDCDISATNNSSNSSSSSSSVNGTTITAIKLPPKKQHDLSTTTTIAGPASSTVPPPSTSPPTSTIMKPLKKSLRRSPEEMDVGSSGESEKIKEDQQQQQLLTVVKTGELTEEVGVIKTPPVLIQSKKHRIFLNKQRQEEEEEQKRSSAISVKEEKAAAAVDEVVVLVGSGGVAMELDKKCIVAVERMEIGEVEEDGEENGRVEAAPTSPLKRNGKINGEDKVNSSSSVVAKTTTPPMQQQQQLQCAG